MLTREREKENLQYDTTIFLKTISSLDTLKNQMLQAVYKFLIGECRVESFAKIVVKSFQKKKEGFSLSVSRVLCA